MTFIEGKFIGETTDPVWDTINLWFEFDLPNGEKYRTRFSDFDDYWAAYDEEKGEIAHFIRSRKGLKQAKAKMEIERRKAVRKEMKSDIALHYLSSSTVPDDEEYEDFYEDETCYSDEELDELEERYFW